MDYGHVHNGYMSSPYGRIISIPRLGNHPAFNGTSVVMFKRLPTLYALLQSLDRRAHAGQEHVVPLNLLTKFVHLVECPKTSWQARSRRRYGLIMLNPKHGKLWIEHWIVVDYWVKMDR